MAQHYPEIIGIVLLLVFAATMFYQGTCIMRGQRGYSLRDYMKKLINYKRMKVNRLRVYQPVDIIIATIKP